MSEVCEFPYLNPQTGPFYVEGAEPGDTIAVHFISVEPARDWAASTTVPLFGALTSTHLTATLQDPLPEVVWIWELDRSARLCRFTARDSDFTADLPMNPMHGMSAWPRRTSRCAPRSCPTPSAATWTPRKCRPA